MDTNYEAFLGLIKKRRSVRRFKTDPIPDDFIGKIIEAARWAPSGANSQPWDFIIVKDDEVKGKISDILKDWAAHARRAELTRDVDMRFPTVANPPPELGYRSAPVWIILCGDPRTKDAYPLLASLNCGDSIFISSLASAFLYMHLAAASLGLASQWLSSTSDPYVQSLVKELLAIPRKLEIYDTMIVGYPAYEPGPRMVRQSAEMVHYDRYDSVKYRSDGETRTFIASLRKS